MRWGWSKSSGDRFQHPVEIVENIVVPEPQHAVAVSRQLGTALFIFHHPLCVLSAVELDHKFARWAGEVGDAGADRMLTPKLPW